MIDAGEDKEANVWDNFYSKLEEIDVSNQYKTRILLQHV